MWAFHPLDDSFQIVLVVSCIVYGTSIIMTHDNSMHTIHTIRRNTVEKLSIIVN